MFTCAIVQPQVKTIVRTTIGQERAKPFRPFHKANTFSRFLPAKLTDFLRAGQAVEVEMVKRAGIFLHQRESRAGNLGFSGVEALDNGPCQRGFARAKVAVQRHKITRAQALAQCRPSFGRGGKVGEDKGNLFHSGILQLSAQSRKKAAMSSDILSAPPGACHETDIAIIGAGPVGLFAVFECGMLKLKCHVVDALDMVGGQCSALYPEKPIYDIPGHPAIEAAELIEKLACQAAPFAPTYHLGQQVVKLERQGGKWTLATSKGTTITAGAVLVAAGCGAFGPNRPPLDNLADYEGKSVFYLVRSKQDFAGKRVVIAGGGDSAVDWALALEGIAKSIALVHRRPKFRAAPESAAKLDSFAKEGRIELVTPYQLAGLEGSNGQLTGVRVADLDNSEKTLPADILLPFFGLSMELGPIADWGLNLEKNHVAVEQQTCATSAPGIFAIGDIATYPGKLKLILCGFSEAAFAAHAAHKVIHPDEVVHFEYSTTKGVPT